METNMYLEGKRQYFCEVYRILIKLFLGGGGGLFCFLQQVVKNHPDFKLPLLSASKCNQLFSNSGELSKSPIPRNQGHLKKISKLFNDFSCI